ncbi:response regulator [Alkalihalobacillus sp. AL-G]|uniref:response regulator n=1 Tax=Alkalihalobacillus sp. AL-G TaxID=2926399 RepID=UPI00351BCBB4
MSHKFLVVDDTNFMRKMAADCLKQYGHEVVGEAANGKEAIRLYKELKPQIVMMDLTMPEMNGIDAIKEILKIDPDAVMLVCSASNQRDLIFESLDAGAKGYLMKPFKPDHMNDIIRKYAEPYLTSADDSEDTEDEETDVELSIDSTESEVNSSTNTDNASEEQDGNSEDENNSNPDTGSNSDVSDEVAATTEAAERTESVEEIEKETERTESEEKVEQQPTSEPTDEILEDKIEEKETLATEEHNDQYKEEIHLPVEEKTFESKERKKPMSSIIENKIKFVTSYTCNWEEEIHGKNNNFSFTYTENDKNIEIEMNDEGNEKQRIQLSLDGFRQLHNWLENQIEDN